MKRLAIAILGLAWGLLVTWASLLCVQPYSLARYTVTFDWL